MTPMANRPWDDILLGFSAFPLPTGAPAGTAHQAYLGYVVLACRQHCAGRMAAVAFQSTECVQQHIGQQCACRQRGSCAYACKPASPMNQSRACPPKASSNICLSISLGVARSGTPACLAGCQGREKAGAACSTMEGRQLSPANVVLRAPAAISADYNCKRRAMAAACWHRRIHWAAYSTTSEIVGRAGVCSWLTA